MANLQEIIPAIFTGPGGQRLTPEQIAQRQQIAQSLIGRATDTRPDAGGWASVLTKGLLGYQSGAGQRAADAAIAQNAEQSQNDIAALLNGGAGYSAPVAGGASPTSAVATGTPVSVPNGDMAGTIRQGLISRGLAPHLADAAILNFQDESGLNPGINEQNPIVAGSRGGYGLYQLTGPRRREYEAFAAQRGVNPADVDAQLDFFMGELAGSEASAGKKFLSSPDTASAAQVLVNDFLRPAAEHRQSRSAKYGRVATTPQEAIAKVSPQGGATILPGQFTPSQDANSVPYNGPGASFGGPELVYDDRGMRYVNDPLYGQNSQGTSNFNDRWNAGAVTPEATVVAPTPTPTPSPEVANALMTQQATGPSESLLAQNDMMLGGVLSPSGSSPVAQALSGYFPDAPGNSKSGSNNQMATIARILGSPYASNEAKQVAMGMYQQQQAQAQSAQEQQRMMAQRQATAGALGINPSLAGADEAGWKAAIDQATRNRNTVTVGNTVYDANTGQPIIQGQGNPTSDIQNFEYARNNGFQGTFADYQQQVKRAGATTVDARQMGNIPPGYQVQYNEQGQPISMSPIPGSPDFIKAQREREAFEKGKVSQDRTSQVVTEDIDRAVDLIDKSPFTTTGLAGNALSKIGGTSSNDVNQLITTIKANAGFDRLQAMRDASPTGGALGAVSERELTYLQSTIGSLDQSQTKEQLIRNLKRVRQAYADIIDGPQDQGNSSDAGWKTLPNGVKIRAKQ